MKTRSEVAVSKVDRWCSALRTPSGIETSQVEKKPIRPK
jgi:hypothetical protein